MFLQNLSLIWTEKHGSEKVNVLWIGFTEIYRLSYRLYVHTHRHDHLNYKSLLLEILILDILHPHLLEHEDFHDKL